MVVPLSSSVLLSLGPEIGGLDVIAIGLGILLAICSLGVFIFFAIPPSFDRYPQFQIIEELLEESSKPAPVTPSPRAKRFVVFGAFHPVGKMLMRMLLDEYKNDEKTGDAHVLIYAFDDIAPPERLLRSIGGRVKFIVGDVRRRAHIEDTLVYAQGESKSVIDCVFHAADMVPHLGHTDEKVNRQNLLSTKMMVEVARAEKRCRALVYVSSAKVVMSSSRNNYIDVCGEDLAYPDAQNLLDTYARAKQAAEKLVLEANGKSPNTNEKEEEDEQKGKEDYEMVHKEDVGEDAGKGNMATLAIRPGIMFGIGDPEWGERLLQGRRVCCSNGSGSTVDFAWSADVAHACMLAFQALEREYTATGKGKSAAVAVAGKAYHIGFGSGARSHVTIGDMLSANWGKSTGGYNGTLMTVLSLCNYVSWTIFARFPFDRHLFPSRLQYLHNMRWSFNNDRAEKDLKYKPIMSFKDTVKYIRNERAKALDNKRRKQHQPKDKVAKKND